MFFFFFQAEDGIRDVAVTGVQTCALPISFRIEQREGGMTTRAWIDAQGHIVRAENAVGFVMERTAFELAYTNFRYRDTTRLMRASAAPGPGDVVATTVLAARARLPRDTVSVFRARLRGGVAPGALELGGGRQQLSGDTLVVRRETAAALAARYRLPARDSSLARKSTRLNSSHGYISYAVFCLKKKKKKCTQHA